MKSKTTQKVVTTVKEQAIHYCI